MTAAYEPRRALLDEFEVLDDVQRLQVALNRDAEDWTLRATDERTSSAAATAYAACAEQLRQTLRSHT